MIDLHMHTKYSDGTDDIITFLKKAEENKLEIISITDHNTVKAYFELDKINIKNYFSRSNNYWYRIKYQNFKCPNRNFRI